MLYIDIDLLRCEGGPHQMGLVIGESGPSERQARPGPINFEKVGLGGAVGKHPVHGQKHGRPRRVGAAG